MKFAELERRLAALPQVSKSFVPYAIDWVTDGNPSPTLVALIPRRDGTVTATVGDLRESVEPVRNPDGSLRVFESEDAACDWAWDRLAPSLSSRPKYSPEQIERARRSAQDQQRRMQAILDDYSERNRHGGEGNQL
jgi:hypothetical protein